MTDNNRNQSYDKDWNKNNDSFNRQQNQDWKQQSGSYNEDLKGGYGGSEYGNSYYRAGNQNPNRNRVNYIPDNDDNYGDYGQVNRSNWGSQNYGSSRDQYTPNSYDQNRNYGNNQYDNDYNPGGYGRVGNTGGNFGDMGGYGNRSQEDRRNYGSSYNERQRNYGNANSRGDRDWWDRTKDEVSSWF